MVVLRGISGVVTPPSVSMPSVSGVTSSSRTSLTSPLSTPAWIAAPTATTSSGLTPLCGSLPKTWRTFSTTAACGSGRRPARPRRSGWARGRRPSAPAAPARRVRSTRSPTSCSSLARVSVSVRCFGPLASAVMNGRLISVCWSVESSIFAFSRGFLQALQRHPVLAQVDALLALELVADPVDDPLVEVVAAEVGVAVGRDDLEDALAQAQDRDVEGAAAEVVDGDRLVLASCPGRRPGWPPSAR